MKTISSLGSLARKTKERLWETTIGDRIAVAGARDLFAAQMALSLASGATINLTGAKADPRLSVLVWLDARAELTFNCLRALSVARSPDCEVICVCPHFSRSTLTLLSHFRSVRNYSCPGRGAAQGFTEAALDAKGSY